MATKRSSTSGMQTPVESTSQRNRNSNINYNRNSRDYSTRTQNSGGFERSVRRQRSATRPTKYERTANRETASVPKQQSSVHNMNWRQVAAAPVPKAAPIKPVEPEIVEKSSHAYQKRLLDLLAHTIKQASSLLQECEKTTTILKQKRAEAKKTDVQNKLAQILKTAVEAKSTLEQSTYLSVEDKKKLSQQIAAINSEEAKQMATLLETCEKLSKDLVEKKQKLGEYKVKLANLVADLQQPLFWTFDPKSPKVFGQWCYEETIIIDYYHNPNHVVPGCIVTYNKTKRDSDSLSRKLSAF